MENKLKPLNRFQLIQIINEEFIKNGIECDLNHIDVSSVTDMSGIFSNSSFTGDISQWDVSNVENMDGMFSEASFNGDISKWDVSKVTGMSYMFDSSKFKQDLSVWKPYSLERNIRTFDNCLATEPYWVQFNDKEARRKAIDNYILYNKLITDIENEDLQQKKKPKI